MVSRDESEVGSVGITEVIVDEPNQSRKRKLATELDSVAQTSGKLLHEAGIPKTYSNHNTQDSSTISTVFIAR